MEKAKSKKQRYAGFSFIELMVAIFILSVIMLVSVSVFANVVLARKRSMKSLNDVSAGRDAIQSMAKRMRVSSQLNYIDASHKSIYFFDVSHGKCVSYLFSGTALLGASASPGGPVGADCSPTYVDYSSSYFAMLDPDVNVDGSFYVIPTDGISSTKVIGRGTINMIVGGKDSLETTVSFLNYDGIIN